MMIIWYASKDQFFDKLGATPLFYVKYLKAVFYTMLFITNDLKVFKIEK